MKKEEILKTKLKDNELLARFENKQFTSGCISDFPEGQLPIRLNKKYLLYHSSWNQLVPIMEKIEQLGFTTLIKYYGDECANFVEIQNNDEDPLQICCYSAHIEEYSKKELVYNAVVEFVKWYNEDMATKKRDMFNATQMFFKGNAGLAKKKNQ